MHLLLFHQFKFNLCFSFTSIFKFDRTFKSCYVLSGYMPFRLSVSFFEIKITCDFCSLFIPNIEGHTVVEDLIIVDRGS